MGGAADTDGRSELRQLLIFDMLAGSSNTPASLLRPSPTFFLPSLAALPLRRAQDAAFMEAACRLDFDLCAAFFLAHR